MTEQAASQKVKAAIRYTLGSKVPHYDFTSIRSDADEIFFNPVDVHNVTTKHFSKHFRAQDASPNFQINYEDDDTRLKHFLCLMRTIGQSPPNSRSFSGQR